ncbi:1905_t:CDS:2, partial [Acaulospora morrowiae]
MKYVATSCNQHDNVILSRDMVKYDQSVCMWEFVEGEKGEPKLKKVFIKGNSDNSLDLKNLISKWRLAKVSDCKHILLRIDRDTPYDFEIIDIKTKSKKILNAQGLKGRTCDATFLKDGRLMIVKGEPVYQVYIFSNKENQWHHTNSIKLLKFDSCVISQERLLVLLDIPLVIMQWNLETLKFEAKYELNWNLSWYSSWKRILYDKFIIPGHMNERDSIIPGYIIQFNEDCLEKIESLSQNIEWVKYLKEKSGEYNRIDSHSCEKEIIETIENTLKKAYESKEDMTQDFDTLKTYESNEEIRPWEVKYYEASIDELTRYVKKVENEIYEEVSRPHLSDAIKKIVQYEKNVDKKISDLDKKFDELDKKFDELDEKLEKLEKID